jgi:hypothetical protein
LKILSLIFLASISTNVFAITKAEALQNSAKELLRENKARSIQKCGLMKNDGDLLSCVEKSTQYKSEFGALSADQTLQSDVVFTYVDTSNNCSLKSRVEAVSGKVKVGKWNCVNSLHDQAFSRISDGPLL